MTEKQADEIIKLLKALVLFIAAERLSSEGLRELEATINQE